MSAPQWVILFTCALFVGVCIGVALALNLARYLRREIESVEEQMDRIDRELAERRRWES